MRVGVVFVHYHTPELARRAVASAERELTAAAGDGVSGRIVVVDNGSDAAGASVLAGTGAEVLRPPDNLGYAGGLGAGAERLADADVLVLANPDVELLPGAFAALLAALARGAAVAGPRFFWDHGRRLRLPPTEPRDAWSEALGLLAPRSPAWAARARRRWRRHARRHWWAAGEIASPHLSGALLAVTRAAWERVGPFDTGFRLYFEETDWLTRLARAGLAARYVPAAEVVHAFARSAAGEPRAAEWFRQSAARYAAKHHGRPRRAVMAALARGTARRAGGMATGGAGKLAVGEVLSGEAGGVAGAFAAGLGGKPATSAGAARDATAGAEGAPPDLDLAPLGTEAPLWLELSPRPEGFPAAGEPLSAGAATWILPEEVRAGLAGTWWARVVDEEGRELLCQPLCLGSGR